VLQMDPMLQQHFPSASLARAWEDLLGFKRLEIFERFGRVAEELELAQKQQAAQEQLAVQAGVDVDADPGPVSQGADTGAASTDFIPT